MMRVRVRARELDRDERGLPPCDRLECKPAIEEKLLLTTVESHAEYCTIGLEVRDGQSTPRFHWYLDGQEHDH